MPLTQVQGGMILASGQSIPKAALPTGSVLQVVQATTNTNVSVTTGGYTDTTLTATITPTSSSSKILVLVDQSFIMSGGASQYGGIRLLRDSTVVFYPAEFGNAPVDYGLGNYGFAGLYGRASINYLDSPATTSAITYKTQGRPYNTTSSGTMIFQINADVDGTSTIILMEIAA